MRALGLFLAGAIIGGFLALFVSSGASDPWGRLELPGRVVALGTTRDAEGVIVAENGEAYSCYPSVDSGDHGFFPAHCKEVELAPGGGEAYGTVVTHPCRPGAFYRFPNLLRRSKVVDCLSIARSFVDAGGTETYLLLEDGSA
jgi:hypothetical protein